VDIARQSGDLAIALSTSHYTFPRYQPIALQTDINIMILLH